MLVLELLAKNLVGQNVSSNDIVWLTCLPNCNYHRITGNLERSLFFFKNLTQICKTLLEGAPDNPEFKDGLAISCQYLGNTHTVLGNLDQALTFFTQYH